LRIYINIVKKIIFVFIISFLFTSHSMSQNAFSDALLLEKNSEAYLKKINLLLTPKVLENIQNKPFTSRQKYYLENLKLFLQNPWDTTIKELNLKIFLEIPQIINGYLDLSDDLKQKLVENKATYEGLSKSLEKMRFEYASLSNTTDTNIKKEEELKKQIDKFEKDSSETSKKISELLQDIYELSVLLKDKNNLTEFNDFKSVLDKINYTLSPLGKDNEELVKETSKESHFSISQAAIIDAIGNAIVEQVREDVVNFLFNEVLDKKFVLINTGKPVNCDDTSQGANCTSLSRELKVLFPKTIELIQSLKEQGANEIYTNISSSLRNTFNEDLKNMLDNLTNDSNMNNSMVFRKFLSQTELYSYFKFGVMLCRQLKNGFHPAEMFPLISDWVSKQNKSNADSNNNTWFDLDKYFSLINLLQKNLRDVTDNSKNIWINITQLDELKKNEVNDSNVKYTSSAEFFLALLYQSDKNKFEFIRKKFYDESNNKFKNKEFDNFKDDLKSFVIMLRTIEQNTNTLINKPDKNINDYETYLDNLDNTLSNTYSLLGKYFLDSSEVIKIQKLLDTIHIYRSYTFDIYKSITNRTYSKILPVVLKMFATQINSIVDSSSFKKELIRYTTLYVDITNAKSQEELNSAIYKSVHNSGGYLRKMSEDFTISVNSYPGFFVGHEKINSSPFIFTPGFTVPLGVNFQFAHHYGIFMQVFDIAAAVNYRVNSEGTTSLPEEVTFKQVFSPGAFLSFNFTSTFPLTLNLGVYVTPSLRKIDSSGLTLDQSKSVRLGFNISYDVPLWYIY
jgi:hypothetical protein